MKNLLLLALVVLLTSGKCSAVVKAIKKTQETSKKVIGLKKVINTQNLSKGSHVVVKAAQTKANYTRKKDNDFQNQQDRKLLKKELISMKLKRNKK